MFDFFLLESLCCGVMLGLKLSNYKASFCIINFFRKNKQKKIKKKTIQQVEKGQKGHRGNFNAHHLLTIFESISYINYEKKKRTLKF